MEQNGSAYREHGNMDTALTYGDLWTEMEMDVTLGDRSGAILRRDM